MSINKLQYYTNKWVEIKAILLIYIGTKGRSLTMRLYFGPFVCTSLVNRDQFSKYNKFTSKNEY